MKKKSPKTLAHPKEPDVSLGCARRNIRKGQQSNDQRQQSYTHRQSYKRSRN